MKRLVFICILLLCIHYSLQVPKYENCDRQVLQGDAAKDCVKVTCSKNKKDYQIQGCDVVQCKNGKQTQYRIGSPHDEFPKCCSVPVCSS